MNVQGERNSEGYYEISLKDKNVKYPSVTTILALLKDAEVAELKDKLDPAVWEYVSKRGADRGSVMHSYLENYAIALKNKKSKDDALLYTQQKTPTLFKNVDPKFFELGRNFFYNIYHSDFSTEFEKPLLIEGLMISPKYKYAGRTDIVYVDHEHNIVMGDYKTSTMPIGEYQRKLIKYKLQIAAYANAFYEMYGKKPKYGCIWIANPTECQRVIVHENEMDIYLFAFLHLVDLFYQKKNKNI